MSESVIDFAGLDSAAATTEAAVEAPVVETTETVETPTTETTTTDTTSSTDAAKKDAKQQYNSDGSPKEAATKTEADDTKEFGEKTPKEIRAALKAFRDANPANITATKLLHGHFERWEAAKAIYPGGIKDMQQAKEFSELIGGPEGYQKLTDKSAAADASDAKLYDPEQNASLIEDVVEDLRAQGKLGNLGTLTSAMLDAAQKNDKEGYDKAIAGHFYSELVANNFNGALATLVDALNDPDPAKAIAAAKQIVLGQNGMKAWFDKQTADNKKATEAVVSPERKQLDAERAKFLKEQTDFKTNQTEAFKNSVASATEKSNNTLLGKSLAPFLKMEFFKGYGKENLMPLGNTIKNNLYAALKSDKAYQAQMKAMWSAATPDRAKIEEYHKARVESLAPELVRSTVQSMYPSYSRGGAAAGRVAAAADKKTVQTKVEQTATAAGKPVYVAVKPKDLDRERKGWEIEEINGRGYLKGSNKWVTWRR
jgi:hypothetical protein